MLLAAGFRLVDIVRSKFDSLEAVPPAFLLFDSYLVGCGDAESLWDLDWETEIARYEGPVLLLHGTQDKVINVFHSFIAIDSYKDAQVELFFGAEHWLYDDDFERAQTTVIEFLDEI